MTDKKTNNLAVKAKNKMTKVYIGGAIVFSVILLVMVVVSKIDLTN